MGVQKSKFQIQRRLKPWSRREKQHGNLLQQLLPRRYTHEDYLERAFSDDLSVIAFLPMIEEEDVNATFEHPENWNQLNLQEKANLIILDNIIKLACMSDARDDDVKEIQALYASTPPSLLGRGPSTVQAERGHNPNEKTEQPRSKAL